MSDAKDKDDDMLDSFLSGDSELSRRYRSGDAAQPSASVDRAILDAAREEAGREEPEHKAPAAPTPRRGRWNLTWERPLAIAAAVMLSAIVVVAIQHDAGMFAPEHSDAEKSMEYRDGAAAPAAGRAEQRPAAPEQRADSVTESRVMSDAPARSEAARSDKGPAARGSFANGLSNEAAELESRSLPAEDGAIQDALTRIEMAWKSGDAERAEQLLERFRGAYPDVGEERLREALPSALLDNDGSH
ncbi:hypothetical protein [Wenzhouxiangella sp. XN24]|uniref:hypothetical protein n=1 Tax=Wenzhouxiangella sp. XN24 TaxID=2713569 RepID=UPI0013EB62D1|nr:hypothetical protein [Wenzhouxiangella sp. XN24]NGX16353.1 hypothetical protein [Wenzhouxiangella sp. XN24]